MLRLQFSEAINCKHQDESQPMENLLSNSGPGKKWLSDPKSFHVSLVGALKLRFPAVVEEIKVGNAGSASICVLVSNNPSSKKWAVLLKEQQLRTEEECRKGENVSSVHTFSQGDFKLETALMPWIYFEIVCYHPHRKGPSEQFGLSFIYFKGAPPRPRHPITVESLKASAERNTSQSTKKSPLMNGSLSRSEKMMIASKAKFSPTSPVESKTSIFEDDVFDACVTSFLESQKSKMTDSEILRRYEKTNSRLCSPRERERFFRLVKDFNNNSSKPSGILTTRDDNRPRYPLSPSVNKTLNDVLKPHLNDDVSTFLRDKAPHVFRTEMSIAKPMKENGVAYPIKENGVYVDQSTKENQHPYMRAADAGRTPDSLFVSEKKCPKDEGRRKKEASKIWTGGRSEDEEEVVSPNQSFKRKSDVIERGLLSKKRLRDARTNGWSPRKTSPARNGCALSPPPRPDSPPVVDDLDKPSTSSTETIAERNIRLEIERRLAQKTPQDRVMRAPSGKVRGPYCTKGVTVRTSPSEANSPLRRLSISEDTDDESRQARRKLHFPRSNGITNMVECPFCSNLYDSGDIEQHASECSPSPRKQQPPEDDDDGDMMACPICMTFVSKDTVASHADQCALKRYGA